MVTLGPSARTVRAVRPRVEILGVFGSGKTTLAARLAGDAAKLLAERHEQNPFWDNSQATSVTGYLAYDLSFLLDHVHLATTPPTTKSSEIGICDWALVSDWLWASMRLGDDLAIYNTVYCALLERVGPPIGYLYLPQPAEVILLRLRKRARAQEERLAEHVEAAIHRLDDLVSSLPADRVMNVCDEVGPTDFRDQVREWVKETRHA